MAVLEQLPEQAPMDLVIGSRDLLRGKVRATHAINLCSLTLMVVVFTWGASGDALATKAPAWLLALAAILAGTVVAAAFTRWRTSSPRQQERAVNRSWRYAKAWATQEGKRPWVPIAIVLGAVVACVALVIVALSIPGFPDVTVPAIVLLAALEGVELARTLRTFRWATWFGVGAMDPDVASELVRATVKAQKVRHYADVYAQNHPTAGDRSA
jgi:hypothetical protein